MFIEIFRRKAEEAIRNNKTPLSPAAVAWSPPSSSTLKKGDHQKNQPQEGERTTPSTMTFNMNKAQPVVQQNGTTINKVFIRFLKIASQIFN